MEKTSENDKTSDLQDSAQTVGSPAAKVDKIPSSAWKTLAILISISTLVMYTETMLVPSLPNIIEEFGLTYSISPWILTTYLIVGAVMTPVTSSLAEIYGKKKILLIVMAVYAAGVIVGGLTTDLYSFIIARGMQGVGMSMFPIAFGVIREQFPKSRLAIGQGVITSMFASGSILGLLVGATIAEFSGWRTTFLSILPIAILLPIVVWRFAKIGEVHPDWQATAPTVQHTQTRSEIKRTLDIKGAATLAATITLFLLSLTFIETTSNNGDGANASGNMQPASLLLILSISCIATFAAFLVVERRAAHPLIDLSLLKNKILLFTNVMMIILGFSMFMVFQTIPILAESPPPCRIWRLCHRCRFNSAPLLDNLANLWPYIRIHSIKTWIHTTCDNGVFHKCNWLFHARCISLTAVDGVSRTCHHLNRIIPRKRWTDEHRASRHAA